MDGSDPTAASVLVSPVQPAADVSTAVPKAGA